MTAEVAAQPRSAPTPVDSGGRLVMQAAGIYREPLQKKSRSPADGVAAMLGELFQELLMAEKRVGRPCGLECFEKLKLSNGRHGNRQNSCCRTAAQESTVSPTRNSRGRCAANPRAEHLRSRLIAAEAAAGPRSSPAWERAVWLRSWETAACPAVAPSAAPGSSAACCLPAADEIPQCPYRRGP